MYTGPDQGTTSPRSGGGGAPLWMHIKGARADKLKFICYKEKPYRCSVAHASINT